MKQLEMGKIGARIENKLTLQEQMRERERLKEEAYQEYLKEKQAVDAAINKMMAEDKRESEVRADKRKTMQDFMVKSIQAKDDMKRRTKEDEIRELEKIKRYQEESEQREAALKIKKAEENAVKEQIYAKLNEEEIKRRTEKEYIENLRIELMQEEHEEAARIRDVQEAEKREK